MFVPDQDEIAQLLYELCSNPSTDSKTVVTEFHDRFKLRCIVNIECFIKDYRQGKNGLETTSIKIRDRMLQLILAVL